MVPTLEVDRDELERNEFINAYIRDKDKDLLYENVIYLLFKPSNIDRFNKFIEGEYNRTKQIIDDYDYEGGYIVAVYQLNHKYEKDFDLIKQGKYSTTSKEFQKIFPKIKKIVDSLGLRKDQLSIQYRIFNKTNDLVEFWENKFGITFTSDMEVWNRFNEEDEILDINKIKEYVK